MRPSVTRRLLASVAAGAMAITLLSSGTAGAASPSNTDPNTDRAAKATTVDDGSAIVQFSGDPLATSTKVNRSANKQVKLTGSGTKSVRAALAKKRNAFRTWLKANAPKAKITGEYDFALNAVAVRLNGTSLAKLRSAPGVIHVGLQSTYRPTDVDPDLEQIEALAGWSAAGFNSSPLDTTTWAGDGVQVGVIDSGIDHTHPCFSDVGFPDTTQMGDTRFTNDKVIAARVFNNKLNQSTFTAEAVEAHGTHVAGTIACNLETPAVVEGVDIPYDPSGVAPGAQLGNYNVFPGTVEDARTEDILNALQAAAMDGMDVINMSLGGDTHGVQDLSTVAVDNLDRAGIVVAVSAGNEGPGDFTIGSPGSAERALTAGASSVGHFMGVSIEGPSGRLSTAAIGDFAVPSSDLTAPLVALMDGDALSTACSAITEDLTDTIALLSRGACTFGTKVANAEAAGAIAVIVVNNVGGDPIAMGSDPAFSPSIPGVMAPLSDARVLRDADGDPVTIGATMAYWRTSNDNLLAGFSSRGPVDVSYRVKPDVVAPGVNVLSSVPLRTCAGTTWVDDEGCWAFYQGTSMASPHLAGMAAVLRAAKPAWQAWQVRSAIINTAVPDGVKSTNDINVAETDPQKVGAGLADLRAAVEADVALSSPSVSFGAVPKGSGQSLSKSLTLTNLSGQELDLDLSVDGPGDGPFTLSTNSVHLEAGGSASITVGFTAAKGAGVGGTQALLLVGDAAHAVLYAYYK